MFNLGQIVSKFRSKNLKTSLTSSTGSLFFDKAGRFNQSERVLCGNFIMNNDKTLVMKIYIITLLSPCVMNTNIWLANRLYDLKV